MSLAKGGRFLVVLVFLSLCKQKLHLTIYKLIVMKFYRGVRGGKVNVIKFVMVIWIFLDEKMSETPL